MDKIKKILIHIKTILIHKWWVLYYSIILRNTWTGIFHDLSKFHPTEFLEVLKYVDGKSSPIPRCKKDKGHSNAWLHHKSHNKHHMEYWIDFNGGEVSPVPIPIKYIKEIVADWLAAGRTYQGSSFNRSCEMNWMKKNEKILRKLLHPTSLMYIYNIMDSTFNALEESNSKNPFIIRKMHTSLII